MAGIVQLQQLETEVRAWFARIAGTDSTGDPVVQALCPLTVLAEIQQHYDDAEQDTPRGPEAFRGHDLIRTGDPDVHPTICDQHGDVVLDHCRRCNGGESELDTPCADRLRAELDELQAHLSNVRALFDTKYIPSAFVSRKAGNLDRWPHEVLQDEVRSLRKQLANALNRGATWRRERDRAEIEAALFRQWMPYAVETHQTPGIVLTLYRRSVVAERKVKALRSLLDTLQGAAEELVDSLNTPDAACTCFISPPCIDCTTHARDRDMIDIVRHVRERTRDIDGQ